ALAIQDELFRETIAEIKDNLSMLRLLLPALYALSAGVGFLASFLFMRGRTREFAVMRLLGVSRPRVTGLVFLEQLVLGALGCLAGAATGVGMQGAGGFSRLFSAALFVLCYLAGALISVGWMTNVSVMALLKADE
ncbi:MAG TPA: hypothetical protein PK438_06720, partial [Clostridia bacterium]|nr:hypothetical protein [Clostridia bacterium]